MRDGWISSTEATKELTVELEKETLGTLIATSTAKHQATAPAETSLTL